MKNKNFRGLDDIPIKELKRVKEVLSIPFAKFVNFSVKLGQFLDVLKIGKVILLHKTESTSTMENINKLSLSANDLKLSKN